MSKSSVSPRSLRRLASAVLCLAGAHASPAGSQVSPGAAWDSIGRILQSPPMPGTGYVRYSFPRHDIPLRVADVTVSPAIALGTWAGFDGDAADATLMGDLVLLAAELKPALKALADQGLAVTAIHNHLAGETPQLTFVHYHGRGNALDLARRLDRVLVYTATPRPIQPTPPAPVTIDTTLVFTTLGIRGRASGGVALLSAMLVPGEVTMHGRPVNPAMGYATPINIQMVDTTRAVATGDFTVPGARVDVVTRILASRGITVTAVHSHLVDEEPSLRYVHFWADGPLPDILRGLRAALDSAR